MFCGLVDAVWLLQAHLNGLSSRQHDGCGPNALQHTCMVHVACVWGGAVTHRLQHQHLAVLCVEDKAGSSCLVQCPPDMPGWGVKTNSVLLRSMT